MEEHLLTIALTCGDNNRKVTLADMRVIAETANGLGLEGHRVVKTSCTADRKEDHYNFHFHYFRERGLIMKMKPIGDDQTPPDNTSQTDESPDAEPQPSDDALSGPSVSPGP
jgi:hypothetical protein